MYAINISGQHVNVTDEMQSYVQQAVQGLEKFSEKITSVNVNITTQKNDTHTIIAEAKIHIPGNDIVASASANRSLKQAVDSLLGKLESQLRKHKNKVLDKVHAKESVDIESPEERAAQDEFDALADRDAI